MLPRLTSATYNYRRSLYCFCPYTKIYEQRRAKLSIRTIRYKNTNNSNISPRDKCFKSIQSSGCMRILSSWSVSIFQSWAFCSSTIYVYVPTSKWSILENFPHIKFCAKLLCGRFVGLLRHFPFSTFSHFQFDYRNRSVWHPRKNWFAAQIPFFGVNQI